MYLYPNDNDVNKLEQSGICNVFLCLNTKDLSDGETYFKIMNYIDKYNKELFIWLCHKYKIVFKDLKINYLSTELSPNVVTVSNQCTNTKSDTVFYNEMIDVASIIRPYIKNMKVDEDVSSFVDEIYENKHSLLSQIGALYNSNNSIDNANAIRKQKEDLVNISSKIQLLSCTDVVLFEDTGNWTGMTDPFFYCCDNYNVPIIHISDLDRNMNPENFKKGLEV